MGLLFGIFYGNGERMLPFFGAWIGAQIGLYTFDPAFALGASFGGAVMTVVTRLVLI